MPEYTYYCTKCDTKFSIVCSISKYHEKQKCSECRTVCSRSYHDDLSTLSSAVKKSDSELKTIGDLANRNRDKMSQDQKTALYEKHNSYKESSSDKPLPTGMSRVKKPPKTIWR